MEALSTAERQSGSPVISISTGRFNPCKSACALQQLCLEASSQAAAAYVSFQLLQYGGDTSYAMSYWIPFTQA